MVLLTSFIIAIHSDFLAEKCLKNSDSVHIHDQRKYRWQHKPKKEECWNNFNSLENAALEKSYCDVKNSEMDLSYSHKEGASIRYELFFMSKDV